jgi:microcystin degradation protein MlrC
MPKRLAIARLSHEGNSLSPARTGQAAFARRDLLCVKARNHFRAAFAQSFAQLIDTDTPGPAAHDLATLPFRQVPPTHLPPYVA